MDGRKSLYNWKEPWTEVILIWVNSIQDGSDSFSKLNTIMTSDFLQKLICQIFDSCKKAIPDFQTVEELSRLFLKDFFPSFLPDICFDMNNEQELLYFTALLMYTACVKCSIDEVIKSSCKKLDDKTQKVVCRFLTQMLSSDDWSITVEKLEEAMKQSLDPSELPGKKSLSPTKCLSSLQDFFDSPGVKGRAKSNQHEMRISITALEEEENCKLEVIKENTHLKKELSKYQSLYNEEKKICKSLQEELSSRSCEVAVNYFPDFTESERKLKQMTIEVKELNKENEALRTENLSLYDQIEGASKEATGLKKELKDRLLLLNSCSEELELSRSNINELQAKISQLEREKSDLLDEAQERSRSRRSLDAHNMSLPGDPEPSSIVIELQLKEKDELIQKLKNEITALTAAFKEEIKQKKASYEIEINILKQHLETQKTCSEELRQQLNSVSSDPQLKEAHDTLFHDFHKLTDEHEALSEKYKQIVAEKDGIRGEYEVKLKKLKEKMKETCFEAMRKSEEHQEKKIKQYKQSILQNEEHIKQLSAQLRATSDRSHNQRDSRAFLNRTRSHENMSRDPNSLLMDKEESITLTRHRSVRTIPSALGKDEMFSQDCLADLKAGLCTVPSHPDRLSTLMYRNSLCPPHLKSSYPAETQFLPLDAPMENYIKGKGDDADNKSITSEKRHKNQGEVATCSNVVKETNDQTLKQTKKPGTPSRIFSSIFPNRHRGGDKNTQTSSSQQPH